MGVKGVVGVRRSGGLRVVVGVDGGLRGGGSKGWWGV